MNQQVQYTLTGLPARLKEARLAAGYKTQGDVCKALNVSRQLWSMFELGNRTPQLKYIVDFANLININVNYLLSEGMDINDAINPKFKDLGSGI